MFREDIQKILEVSINAPSGSNSQPWKFKVYENQVDVIALPEKDHPVLNFRNRGTWVAHGALLENILVASSAVSYKTTFKVFLESSHPNLTARIFFEKGLPQKKEGMLYNSISKRATNRKPYKLIPLTAPQKEALMESVQEIGGGVDIKLIEDREKIKTLGEASAVNEIVTLENRLLHRLFFDEIVWTKEEEQKRGQGLFLKTMELKPPQERALRLFRNWKLMKLLNKFKIARQIAHGNAKIYSSAPVMGAIIVKDNDEEFLKAGRLLERVWLKVISFGFSLQLVTGVLFFHQNIKAGNKKDFSDEHIKLIGEAYDKMASVFGVDSGIIALMFRIGDGGEPTARSLKIPPEIILE